MEKYINATAGVGLGAVGVYNIVIAYIASGLAYLTIDSDVLGMYVLLMMVDLFTGVTAAFIRHEHIARRVFMAGLATKVIMLSIPIVIAMLVKMNSVELEWLIKWSMIVLGISETISILNNYLKAKGKDTLPEIDAISMIAKRLRAILLKLFDAAEVDVKS